MKKILFPLLFCASYCFSQDARFNNPYLVLKNIDRSFSYRGYSYDDYVYDFAPKNKRKQEHISKIKSVSNYKKGKQITIELDFNKSGFQTLGKNLTKDEVFFKAEYQFDSLETYRYLKHKKNITEVKREYTNGKKTKEIKLKKGKQVYQLDINYNSVGKITESRCTKKGKIHKMINSFNSENQLTKTEYFIDSKLKKVWNYECKPQGELVASTKNEIISSKCEFREESKDGSYIVFTRTLIKEKPYLKEEKFTKDSVKFEENNYINDSILSSKWFTEDKWNVSISYRKGKLKNQNRYKLDDNNKITEIRYIYKNKIKSITKHSYDANGNRILTENFDPKKLNPTSNHKSEFNEDGTMKSSTYSSEGKVYSSRTYEYTKY